MSILVLSRRLKQWWWLLICLCGGSTVQGANEWPQFRGPRGNGISTATHVPVHWSATSNVVWKVPLAGNGWSSPVLARDRVYLTAGKVEPDGVSLQALSMDAQTGKLLWSTEVFKPGADVTQARHQKNSHASPTPIVDANGDRLYVHFGHLGTAALDLSGKIVWRQNELRYPPVHGNGSSPALIGQTLVINCDSERDPFVAGLDAATGKVQWKTPRDSDAKKKFSFSTPTAVEIDGQRQAISAGSGFVGGYDPGNGHELWRVRYGEGYSLVPRPVYAHGLIYASTGFDRPEVMAINPKDARGDATAKHVVWTINKGAPNTPSLLVVGNEVYFVSDAGIASCVDALTGTVHWSERVGGNYSASPVYAEGRIYFQNETGTGVVVAAKKQFEVLARNELGERTLASPAVVDRGLFVRSEAHLWRIGSL